MSAGLETRRLQDILNMRGIAATWDDANTLRRAQITLQRWAEQECGDSNDYMSWAIERDEQTGVPYRVTHPHQGNYGYSVWCQDDAGNMERTTRRVFSTQEAAQEYAKAITPKRTPEVRPVLSRSERIADREKGALKRVAEVCKRLGCHFFHQTDPRGCSLYVSADPIKDNDYTRGTACVVCN